MMADFLGTYSDDDVGSSTDSDTDSDQEMACDDEEKLSATTVDMDEEKLQARMSLKIILAPRKLSGSAATAERISITDSPIDYEDAGEDGDEEPTDFDYDAEMEDEIEEPEHYEYASMPPLRSRRSARWTRSPLSASHSGALPVYAAYRCVIEGCNFSASSAQHLRHHVATASHSMSFRRAGTRMTAGG